MANLSGAKSFVSFLNKAVTPFHAVESCATILKEAGFQELRESDPWQIVPLGKYFVTKNRSAIFAFAIGGKIEEKSGFSMIAAHTDSPCLRVKPISNLISEKFLQVGVSTYGGGIWRTWFDRDLSVAGEVIFQKNSSLVHKLIDVRRPILSIPNLAIHLETDRTKFEWNNETHLRPILATQANEKLGLDRKDSEKSETKDPRSIVKEHHDEFLKLVAEQAGCKPEEIVDLDLYLYDTQPAAITGLKKEFISGARLDNLVGTYTSVIGLIQSLQDGKLANDPNIRLVACFDNEEVGSGSAQGAETAFTQWLLRRLVGVLRPDVGAFELAIANSYMISADQAHACHPNYGAKHDDKHRPAFHQGVVVKVNVNQRYATTATTHSILKVIAHKANVPLQKVVVRNDSPCGSTVGPILSAKLGLQTIDVGCPQLAMHSIREFADTSSIQHATTLFSTFFSELPDVLKSIQ